MRAVLCHLHGFAEHSGCYDEFFSSMRQHGIRIIAFDMRGHGRTRENNEKSYLLEVPYADIDCVLDYARKEAPMTPVFLSGHSMGGRFVLSYLRDAQKAARLSGALLIGKGEWNYHLLIVLQHLPCVLEPPSRHTRRQPAK